MTCALGTELRRVTSSCGELVACLASLVLGSGLRCPSTFMCSVQLQQVASDIWIPENLVSAAVNNWGVRWLWRLARRVFLFANITLNQQQFYRCNYPNFELLTALRNAPTSANILLFIGNRRSQGSSRWSRRTNRNHQCPIGDLDLDRALRWRHRRQGGSWQPPEYRVQCRPTSIAWSSGLGQLPSDDRRGRRGAADTGSVAYTVLYFMSPPLWNRCTAAHRQHNYNQSAKSPRGSRSQGSEHRCLVSIYGELHVLAESSMSVLAAAA